MAWNAPCVRRERPSDTALTPSTTLVSLTAFRDLDFEFFVDADITKLDLSTTHHHERQHQLSEELALSHQQPRLTWVGGVFLFGEADHQILARSAGPANPGSAGPAHRRGEPRDLRTGDGRIDLPALGHRRVRYTHEGKDIDNAGGRYSLDAPVCGSWFGLHLLRLHLA